MSTPSVPASPWTYASATGGITNTTAVQLVAGVSVAMPNGAANAKQRNFLSALQYHNSAATASEITVLDGSTVIWRGYAPASMTYPALVEFPVALQSSPGNALNVQMGTTATATRVSAQGFTQP